jgi:GntR family transcriptional regulator/MocR family aminotransferase
MRDALFHLERERPASLQAQIRDALIGEILSGRMIAGEPAPSTRAMAKRLGVSRNTVTLAYQALVADGFLKSRERSGYYVDADAIEGSAKPATPVARTRASIDWDRRMTRRPALQRRIMKPEDWRAKPYPFIYGQVDVDIFPISDWRDCVRQAMGKRWIDDWSVDRYAEDDPLLVQQIVRRLLPRRGIAAREEEVIITLGAQNALYLLSTLLVREGTRAAMEDPGYPDMRNILAFRTPDLRFLPVDGDGVAVDERMRELDLLYTTPSHQFPTTATMSLERRKALLAAAEAEDFVVIEDDYEFETNYVGEPLPALKSLDGGGRVIYVGSFSKSLMPGLRLGFIVADAALIEELRALRTLMLRHPPGNNQRTAAFFLANGHFDALVRRIHRVYRERWTILGAALKEQLPGWARTSSFGGSSYWLQGSEGFDAGALQAAALSEGVVIEKGSTFFRSAEEGRRNFRLGFSSIATDRIEPGLARLKGVIDRMERP